LKRAAIAALCAAGVLLVTGCGHKQLAYTPPPPPPPSAGSVGGHVPYETFPPSGRAAAPPEGPGSVADSAADLQFVESHRPIWTETGLASWYGPPYDRHRGANGEIYDQNMLSAADRVLPLDSLVRVTNVRTGQSAVMRVTDRGPFVPGRVLDLSKASAKAVGVYLPGTAEVRIEAFYAPKPIAEGGRWCVQIGAFHSRHDAEKLQERLQREYAGANVIEFKGPTGDWVRIRPQGDNREQAEAIEQSVQPKEGAAYLTRLD
jgi:rare lipoprotein A